MREGAVRNSVRRWVAVGMALAVLTALVVPKAASARNGGASDPRADVRGRPIALAEVGRFYCHDFDFPRIHCFESSAELDAAVATTLSVTAVDYVLVFENAGYNGASMYISSNYSALATVGWNDRISSFKGRNSQSGKFWTDWFYSGSFWSFCCNNQISSLGSFDNTFSSVHRT